MAFNKEKVMDSARKLAEKNQHDKAVKEYLRVVQEDPKDIRVWLKIGDLHVKRGSKQDATEVYLKVARVYAEQGFTDKAIAVFKQVLKIDPHLVDVNLRLAELYRQRGLLADAMQHFEAVAGHFHREGNTKEALATVRQLVELDPENVATRIKLAELYSKENLTADAIAEFIRATDQLRKQARQEDFIKVAERLLWHQPENIALSRELAALYLRRGDARRALQKLQACFKADARDVETLAMLAQAFQALDQGAKTVSVLKELAKIHDENKQTAKADAVFRKILEFVPNDPDALARVGVNAMPPTPPPTRAATPPPLRATTGRAATPPPVRPPANKAKFGITADLPAVGGHRMTGAVPLIDDDNLALAKGRAGSNAAADFSHELKSEDRSYRSVSVAGERHAEEISKVLAETDVYLKYGLHQKAIDHLRRVFDLDPDNFEARERLKDVYLAQGREGDALDELMQLAESTAPVDVGRAVGYLREALAVDAGYRPAHELARRHRLDLSVSEEEAPPSYDYSSGAVAIVDDDGFDDLAFDEGPRAPLPPVVAGPRAASFDDVDDFDPADLIAPHGSPVPARPPGPMLGRTTMPSGSAASSRGGGVIVVPPLADEDDFSLDALPDAGLPAETRQVDVDEVQAMAHATLDADDLEFEDGVVERSDVGFDPGARGGAGWGGPTPVTPVARPIPAPRSASGRIATPAPDTWSSSSEWAVARAAVAQARSGQAARLDDETIGQDIDDRIAAEFAADSLAQASGDLALPADELPPDDLPFDPAAARAFDAQVGSGYADARARFELEPDVHDRPTGLVEPGPEFELEAASAGFATPAYGADVSELPPEATATHGEQTGLAPPPMMAELSPPDEATAFDAFGVPPSPSEVVGRAYPAPAPEPTQDAGAHTAHVPATAPPPGNLEDELDEADFYISQGMNDEAVEILHGLLIRYPGHALVEAKLAELGQGGAELDATGAAELTGPSPTELAAAAIDPPSNHTQALDLEELDVVDDLIELDPELDDPAQGGPQRSDPNASKPAVMLERPVEDGDADTHYDLGQAYKDMGLHDEAIKAFEKAARGPSREAQARLMIGLCYREQHNPSAAVNQFKQALHAPSLTDLERQSLYYEIGVSYDGMKDAAEALYYLEMVVKRDPTFLDAGERVQRLRAAGGAARAPSRADGPGGEAR
ncbi:MAG: tetratricopeptide repeat protein [Kofleriaceae bacterium]